MKTMKLFGYTYHPCLELVETPIGVPCSYCEEKIEPGDRGIMLPYYPGENETPYDIPYHRNCFLRTILGSVGHQRKTCSCCGGDVEDPPGMTRRQAADASAEEYKEGANND